MSRLKMTFLDRPAPDWAVPEYAWAEPEPGLAPLPALRRRGGRHLAGRLADQQKRRCYYCEKLMHLGGFPGAPLIDLATVDHVVALSRGGSDDLSNKVAACYACNQAKGALSEAEFRAVLLVRSAAPLRLTDPAQEGMS